MTAASRRAPRSGSGVVPRACGDGIGGAGGIARTAPCGHAMERSLLAAGAMNSAISNHAQELDAIGELLGDLTDRPRERLWRCGPQALGDAELISVVLGTGVRDCPVLELSGALVRAV